MPVAKNHVQFILIHVKAQNNKNTNMHCTDGY